MERNTKILYLYLAILAPVGAASLIWAGARLDPAKLDAPLAILTGVTLVFGSYFRIQLPRTKIHLTLSDTLIFVGFLTYGPQVAILLGTIEALVSSLNFRRQGLSMKTQTLIINVLVTAMSISAMALVSEFVFGDTVVYFSSASLKSAILLLGTMATAQFFANSILVSTIVSIRSGESLWHVWNEYCFNALVIFLTGAVMSGIVVTALREIDPFLFAVVGLFFFLVYLTYVRYVNDIKEASAIAEQAERDRAEQAETHLGQLKHYVNELERTAEALRESRERFRHAAYHDALTGLANRNQFIELLEPCLSEQGDADYAVLFLDLNRFKTVNDSLGHSAGDLLIVNVARRLQNAVEGKGMVGRLSGDEFVVLLKGVSSDLEAIDFATRIDERISAPYDLEGRQIFTSVSIGIAMGNARYKAPDELLRDADIAMYYAKETSQSYVIFDQIMHARAVSLLELETDLQLAVNRGEFELYYQPLVMLKTGGMMGFEALVRWHHPGRGLITPGEFISVAETTGLIVPMTLGLLRKACCQLVEWKQKGLIDSGFLVSVNISAIHLAQGTLVEDLREILSETGVDPGSLKLEITESAVMEDAENVIRLLSRIKQLGVKLSIDDFGTGYSSLSYLQKFPIDTLKIDRSFVGSMEDSAGNGEIVRTVVALANALNLDLIAEGIESIDQYESLRRLGCQYGQGFLFSRPVPVKAATEFLVTGRKWEVPEEKILRVGNGRVLEVDRIGVH